MFKAEFASAVDLYIIKTLKLSLQLKWKVAENFEILLKISALFTFENQWQLSGKYDVSSINYIITRCHVGPSACEKELQT